MKKVLHIRWGERIGGVESLLRDIAKFTDKTEFETTFCFFMTGGQWDPGLQEHHCRLIVIPATNGYDVVARLRLLRTIWEVRPDIVVEHGLPPLFRPVMRIAGRFPLVTFDHGCYELYKIKGKHLSNWLIKIEYIKCVDLIVTNSNYNKRVIVDNYRVAPEKVKVIYPGVDVAIFKRARPPVRNSLVVGYIGRIQFGDKGTDLLLPVAAQLVRDNFLHFEFRVFGDGPDRQSLEAMIRDSKMKDNFRFYGAVRSIPERIAELDVAIVTSRSEAFGLSALEALSAGCYVACFDVGGLRESIGSCEQAILIKPFDTTAMARTLESIWSQGLLTGEASRSARRYVENRYPVESFVHQLENTLKQRVG